MTEQPSAAATISSDPIFRRIDALTHSYTGKITCCENCLGVPHDLFFIDGPQPTVELLCLRCGEAKQQRGEGVWF